MRRSGLSASAGVAAWLSVSLGVLAGDGRMTVGLDGLWQIEESVSPAEMPASFGHRCPVPGLANLAEPPFPDIGRFDSKELIANRIRNKKLPESARVQTSGIARQERDYLWYRTTFEAPPRREAAILSISKAQFGTAVWLNGKPIGEYPGCFSASRFTVTPAVAWGAENTLVVRVGAHPGVLPDTYPTGTDFEKLAWTPGIYDSVSIAFCDGPVIEGVQVAPRIASSEIVIQTAIVNPGAARAATLVHRVRPWKGEAEAGATEPLRVDLAAGESKVLTQTMKIADAKLWSPETPHLYILKSRTDGDSVETRFGMREFKADPATRRVRLNGSIYYLRGSNVTLHRFFEDPKCGGLPWDETWLRRLLVEIPKTMGWNSFRFCIGPVPDRWLSIADEAGLLIQNEFFVWTGAPSWDKSYSRTYDIPELARQYADWVRDGWNHPSVAIWDANNETLDEVFAKQIIPAVRPLDLSRRPWENSYNGPAAPDDVVEEHPYLFSRLHFGDPQGFRMTDLEGWEGEGKPGAPPPSPHVRIINEYGWLWLNRDGTPTLLTEKVYGALLGPGATAEERFALNAYLLAGKTEYWRAHRRYAGVLHFVYLTCSYPGVFTSDHFRDVEKLQLEPHFADYAAQAFKPLGVYLRFFGPALRAGAARTFTVMLVNDRAEAVSGTLDLSLTPFGGKEEVAGASRDFSLPALGDGRFEIALAVPSVSGKHVLAATARPRGEGADGGGPAEPTVSRRWVTIEPEGAGK